MGSSGRALRHDAWTQKVLLHRRTLTMVDVVVPLRGIAFELAAGALVLLLLYTWRC